MAKRQAISKSLEELIESEKTRTPLTKEESFDQAVAIAHSELRRAGDKSSTVEDVEAAVRIARSESPRALDG